MGLKPRHIMWPYLRHYLYRPARTMQEERDDETICTRLQQLTIAAQLDWRPMYTDGRPSGISDAEMKDATKASGYVLRDQMHGFGIVTVRVDDPRGESYADPALFLQGQRADVDAKEVGILLDAIQTHLNEIRSGERKSIRDRIDERVAEEVQPYEEQIASLQARLRDADHENKQLVQAIQNMAGSQATTSDEDDDTLELNAENVRATLRHCFDEEGDVPATFDDFFDESVVEDAIEDLRSEENPTASHERSE